MASHHKRLIKSQQVVTQCSIFLTLPAELIGAIFDELDMFNALYLTGVCQRLREIGWPYLEKKFMNFLAPWAGHRLICVGEEHPDDVYPPDMLSKVEQEEMERGFTQDEFDAFDEEDREDLVDCMGKAILLHGIAEMRYAKAEVDIPCFVTPTARVITQHELRERYFPNDRKWVLRNLTTHEFVRSDALAGNSEQNGPYFEDIGFEHIILSRICWSSSSRDAEFDDRSINRGIWAGHRFEITTLDFHQRSILSSVPWKDISEDVVEDIIQLWRAAGNYNVTRLKRE